jgi:hypothetical protein
MLTPEEFQEQDPDGSTGLFEEPLGTVRDLFTDRSQAKQPGGMGVL